jgi:hypothetical protein
MKKIFAFAAFCSSVIVSTSALADDAKNLQDFEKALVTYNLADAAAAYGRIFDTRLPKDGKPKADATLDALVGRFALAVGDVFEAQAFLQSPSVGDISNAPARMLATAEVELLLGNYEVALAASQRAVQGLTDDAKTQALIGQAQALIMIRPGEVATLVKSITTKNPALAWRISFLEAQSALIAKDYPAAQKAADRATLQANVAPLRDYAPLQTLQLQAAVATAQGLKERAAALLAAVPSSSGTAMQVVNDVVNRLPACGVDGIREDDYVIIGMFTQSAPMVAIPLPLAASRLEIVAPFMRSIAGFRRIKSGTKIAAYPLMTVRCSVSDTDNFRDDKSIFINTAFIAVNHLRPRFFEYEFNYLDDPVTEATKVFDRIEESVGVDSSILMYPLTELAEIVADESSDVKNNTNTRYFQFYRRAYEIVNKIGNNQLLWEFGNLSSDISKNYDKLNSMLETLPIEFTYSYALNFLELDQVPPVRKLAVVEIMLKRLGTDRRDRRVLTMVSRKASLLRRVGRSAEVEAFARVAKIDPALCPAKATLPIVTDGGVTTKDYPRDAIAAEISGGTVVEVDVDAGGKVARLRQLVEAPALIFADAVDKASQTMKLDASRDSKGRLTPCRAFRARIRWELPPPDKAPSTFGDKKIGI